MWKVESQKDVPTLERLYYPKLKNSTKRTFSYHWQTLSFLNYLGTPIYGLQYNRWKLTASKHTLVGIRNPLDGGPKQIVFGLFHNV